MPLYSCNAKTGAIPDKAKAKIAKDITDIHCDVTDAPPTFVHAFFFEEAAHQPLGEHTAFLFGQIRSGRTEEQKQDIRERMAASISAHAGIPVDQILVMTTDTPAKWVMEGGDLLPEPGEEADWLAAHEAKLAAAEKATA
ncbi:MAG: tautomerase family protein [Pseudomonadota bacterium]